MTHSPQSASAAAEPARNTENASTSPPEQQTLVICPVCGAAVVQEKCKLICRSEICRGRVVYNCSEF